MHKKILKRNFNDTQSIKTSHGVGDKWVVGTRENVGSPITQIARTRLLSGEKIEAHVHPTMDEHYFLLAGECELTIDGVSYLCHADDYLYIPAGSSHSFYVKKDVIMITIGIEK